MNRLRILTICTLGISCLIFFSKLSKPITMSNGKGLLIKKEWLAQNTTTITPIQDRRPADQTFLTYPEWYLVFSPEEQANYFKTQTATSFPFNSHTRQIWESYQIVNNQIKGNFPPNQGYHFMIWVIGTSASIEYSIKSWYETLIGRITDTHVPMTDEDIFNAKFTQDYVSFIKDRPWYEFDFKSRLFNLWTENSFWGAYFMRKIERKYILTSELFVKWMYGKLIGIGTKKVYEEALPTTLVVLEDNSTIVLPRYDKFNAAICKLALEGKIFKEIAGNNSAILITILKSKNKEFTAENTQELFKQPITSDTDKERIALVTPVTQLNKLLVQLQNENIFIEHIFDF